MSMRLDDVACALELMQQNPGTSFGQILQLTQPA
jgi:hypothetical protein